MYSEDITVGAVGLWSHIYKNRVLYFVISVKIKMSGYVVH